MRLTISIDMIRKSVLILLLGVVTVVNAQTDRQLINGGNRKYRMQDYPKAEVMYRKALEKNQSNPQAMYNLGCALMMQNKDSMAIVMFERAAKEEPNKLRRASVYHNIGVMCQSKQLYGDAINAYEQSLRDNPKDDETRYNLALCKKLQKEQGGGGGSNQNKKDNNNDEDKSGQNKKDNKDKKDDKDKNNQQQSKEQMSKENAEQMLNAAIQNEKDTQERMKKAMQKPSSRQLEKNW
ncbi:MAG: tetratricopeptide repeat protein [Prevotella sp.]|nr:tetratricopeptide repeat protein [Prevotella sp.]